MNDDDSTGLNVHLPSAPETDRASAVLVGKFEGAADAVGAGLAAAARTFARSMLMQELVHLQKVGRILGEKREARGIKSALPLEQRHLRDVLAGVAKADSDTLREMWAELLARGTDPEDEMIVHGALVRALRDLEPEDALMLRWFRAQGWTERGGNITFGAMERSTENGVTDPDLSFAALMALGLVEEVPDRHRSAPIPDYGLAGRDRRTLPHGDRGFRLSILGMRLLEATRPPED